MLLTILKAVGTLAVIILISEIQKRSNALAAAIAALPLMTMITVFNLATDPKAGPEQASLFSNTTFLLFWPGLAFFVLLFGGQQVLKLPFWWSFGIAVVITFASTWGFTVLLRSIGVKID
jgi:hypothetical protein